MNVDIELFARIALVLVMIGLIAASIRLVLGPSSADRIVALDLITVQLVAIAALLALTTGESTYLDVCIALALVGFLATVAFARYVERRPVELEELEEGKGLPGHLAASIPERVPGIGTLTTGASQPEPADQPGAVDS